MPITFDAEMNEYHLMHLDERAGYSMIRFCPWCGGAAPRSLRAAFFSTITQEEEDRLRELLRDIKTLDDAIEKLGKPDADLNDGVVTKTPGSDEAPQTIKSYRALLFGGLSTTADVRLTDYGPDGGVRVSFTGKFLGTARK